MLSAVSCLFVWSVTLLCGALVLSKEVGILSDVAGRTDPNNLQTAQHVLPNSHEIHATGQTTRNGETSSLEQQTIENRDGKTTRFADMLASLQDAKSKLFFSKISNLLGLPVGDRPLQDLLKSGVNLARNLNQETVPTLDGLFCSLNRTGGNCSMSKAEIYKDILRSLLISSQKLETSSQETNEIEDDLCRPAEFTPPTRKPAEYRGPGMKLTFKTGACALDFNKALLEMDFDLYCYQPSLIYFKTPPTYISEHTTPAVFVTRECKEETMNNSKTKAMLHTFDGSSLLNPSILKNIIFENAFPSKAVFENNATGDGFLHDNTIGDILGTILNWDTSCLDLRNNTAWDLLS